MAVYAKAQVDHPVYTFAASTASNGRTWISTANVAKLIRSRLKKEFPKTKFSVTSKTYTGGSSIRIDWIDGPTTKEVNEITRTYRFADFDGSIDLRCDNENWLLPDGSMSLAQTPGTAGSMGIYSKESCPAPHPRAIQVCGGADYVFCQRELSDAAWLEFCRRACERYGVELIVDRDGKPVDQRIAHAGEYLFVLARRASEGAN